MKHFTKLFVLAVAVIMGVTMAGSAFAAGEPIVWNFEEFDEGQQLENDSMAIANQYGWLPVNIPAQVKEVDGSKVLCMGSSLSATYSLDKRFNGMINIFRDDELKPVLRFGNKYVMEYDLRMDMNDGITDLVFNDRPTRQDDEAAIEVLRIWSNTKIESSDGQIGPTDVEFGKWHKIVNSYDFDDHKISTYVDGVLQFTQPIPSDYTGFCYETLGCSSGNTSGAYGMIYLDNIRLYAGTYDPSSADTSDFTAVAAMVAAAVSACAVLLKKSR